MTRGKFAGDIVAADHAWRNQPTSASANVAVVHSDAAPQSGYAESPASSRRESLQSGYVGFPNGRRPGDDTVDTLLYFITNQTLLTEIMSTATTCLRTTFVFRATSTTACQWSD
jgi:hypothetical protein